MIDAAMKLKVVEWMLEGMRGDGARSSLDDDERHAFSVFKEIAKDYRAQVGNAPGDALLALQRRIADAAASKTGAGGIGFDPGALAGIGQEVIGRWPTVRRALEEFEKKRTI